MTCPEIESWAVFYLLGTGFTAGMLFTYFTVSLLRRLESNRGH